MKKYIVTILFALAAMTATAGDMLRFGIGAGLTHSEFKSPSDWTHSEDIFNDAGTGYFMKMFLKFNVPVLPIYIQPEASYSFQKSINTDELKNVTIEKLDFPILVGAQMFSGKIIGLRINAGPVFNVSDSSDEKTQALRWTAGAGIDLLDHLTLDVRYHGRFKDNSYNSIDTNFNYWSYSIGFMF